MVQGQHGQQRLHDVPCPLMVQRFTHPGHSALLIALPGMEAVTARCHSALAKLIELQGMGEWLSMIRQISQIWDQARPTAYPLHVEAQHVAGLLASLLWCCGCQ